MRQDWGKMAEEYLAQRRKLALFVQLIDSRHEPTALDRQLNEWLKFNKRPHIAVATKADKLSKNALQKSIKSAESTLANTKIIAFSSQSGLGRDELWLEITRAIGNY
jgi:GTP-binding protein